MNYYGLLRITNGLSILVPGITKNYYESLRIITDYYELLGTINYTPWLKIQYRTGAESRAGADEVERTEGAPCH